jgi:hypothetical protein
MSGEKSDFLTQMMAPANTSESDAGASETVVDTVAPGETASAAPAVVAEAAPPAAKSEPDHVPIAAVMAEREKRQKYEKELAEAKRQLEEIQRTQTQQVPEFYADPEGYVQSVVSQAEFRARDRTYAMLEEEQREAHEDFDTHFEAALAEAQQNPAVAKEILNARNPAKAAYNLGKRMAQTAALTADPAKYEAEMRAKFRAEWEAEQSAKQAEADKAAAQAKLDAIPPDLASERSMSSRRAPKTDVFDQLFKPKP